jgi:biotin carboxylase
MEATIPTLLLLGGANPNAGLMCIEQARSRGLNIWLTDTEENLEHAPEIVAAVDNVTVLSYRDVEACVAWSVEQAKTTPFVGVYGFREFAVEAVAAVAEALGLPGNPLQQVYLVRNKLACRQALQAKGFRQPAISLCSSLSEAQAFIEAHPVGPWIMKPPAAMGSVGVSLIRNAVELEQAIAYLDESCNALAKKLGQQGIRENSLLEAAREPFLMECFQRGEEFSAEGVFVYGRPHVLTTTAKVTFGPPHFVEVGHSMPANIDPDTLEVVRERIEAALVALGLRWGQFHVEFWLDEGEPVLGEVHVRPGGDFIHYMTQHVTGIELYGVLFDQMLQRPVNIDQYRPRRGAAIRFVTPPPGRVTSIDGWEEATSDPHCLVSELKLHVGDHIGPVYSSSDRHIFVLADGETARDAVQQVERLATMVQVQVQQEVAEVSHI